MRPETFAPGDRVFVFVVPAKGRVAAGFGSVQRSHFVHSDVAMWDVIERFEVRLDDGNLVEVSAADLYDAEDPEDL